MPTPARRSAPPPSRLRAPARAPFQTVILPSLLLGVAMFNLTLPVIGLEALIVDGLGGSLFQVSLFFSTEMVAYVLFAPVWGVASDRLGRRRPLVIVGFLVSALLYASFAFASSVGVLLLLRFVQGVFSVMGWSSLMAIVVDEPAQEGRGRNMGIMGACLIFGISMGIPVGAYLTSHFGPEAPLFLASGLFLVLAAMSLVVGDPRTRLPALRLASVRDALVSRPRLLLPYLFHFADRYTVGLFVVLFPLYLESLGAGDPAVRGRYLAVFLLPFAFLQAFTGRLTDRWGPLRPLVVGSFLYGLGLCLVGYSGLYALWWVMAALGILASIMFPPAIALTGHWSHEETRGAAMGGFNLAGSAGFAVGPVAGALIYERLGAGPAFVLAGAVELAACLVAVVYLSRRMSAKVQSTATGGQS